LNQSNIKVHNPEKTVVYETEFEELKEELETSRTTIQQMIDVDFIQKQKISNIRHVFEDAVINNKVILPHKYMGVLGEVCYHQIGTAKTGKLMMKYVRNPNFDPFIVRCVSGVTKEIVNDNDEMLITLRKSYSENIVQDVLRAVRELKERNPSGRYPVVVPWDFQNQREMEWSEVFELLILHISLL
jgi:hypothetical protein